ncbi:MAG TPA: alkaline phosphatase family protein [Solirubrobacteraceae bacterium]|nr:alkaline phosphatase family protein [Solirubrobacteraceae bacterium]
MSRAARPGRPPKLVLTVIDGLRSPVLEQVVSDGEAPHLAAVMERGHYVDDCAAAFPSVTPVCTASIATGAGPDAHRVPGMNWFHRAEDRYVEYGSSFQASRAFGVHTSLTDTIYNLNLAHLSRGTRTVFEHLDDAGVRTAGTTFLITRGRHRVMPTGESALARLAGATLFRHPLWGPRELFYADMFATRKTGCRSQLGLPGARDAHAGCVGAHLVEHDLFDFLLLSLPDNDTHSHRRGPDAQGTSAVEADRQIGRLMEAGGGIDAFLEEHAMIVLADHAHSLVEERVNLLHELAALDVLHPDDPQPERARVALSPGQRSAMVYALDPEEREATIAETLAALEAVDGVDLLMWREDGDAVVRSPRGELRFSPGGRAADARGERWTLDGQLNALEGTAAKGVFASDAYPDALARVWSALTCPTAGDVLVSAAPGFEFVDWGGADHLGGGSHGSLHRGDSLGPLLWCGCGPDGRDERAQWTLRDVLPMVLDHFGVAA